MNAFIKIMTIAAALFVLAGCESVKPWQKGNLARYEMGFSADVLEQKLNDHTYFAKEASSSGNAVSGGGCGCN